MPVANRFTELDVTEQIRLFVAAVLGDDVPAILGQVNRVAEPLEDDYVIMWVTGLTRLATNVETYASAEAADPTTMEVGQSSQWRIQLDVHGDASTTNAQMLAELWRSRWACDFLRPTIIAPLYADDPTQAPFINAEDQYETRWVLSIYLQVNVVLTLPQEYANALRISIHEADR